MSNTAGLVEVADIAMSERLLSGTEVPLQTHLDALHEVLLVIGGRHALCSNDRKVVAHGAEDIVEAGVEDETAVEGGLLHADAANEAACDVDIARSDRRGGLDIELQFPILGKVPCEAAIEGAEERLALVGLILVGHAHQEAGGGGGGVADIVGSSAEKEREGFAQRHLGKGEAAADELHTTEVVGLEDLLARGDINLRGGGDDVLIADIVGIDGEVLAKSGCEGEIVAEAGFQVGVAFVGSMGVDIVAEGIELCIVGTLNAACVADVDALLHIRGGIAHEGCWEEVEIVLLHRAGAVIGVCVFATEAEFCRPMLNLRGKGGVCCADMLVIVEGSDGVLAIGAVAGVGAAEDTVEGVVSLGG